MHVLKKYILMSFHDLWRSWQVKTSSKSAWHVYILAYELILEQEGFQAFSRNGKSNILGLYLYSQLFVPRP